MDIVYPAEIVDVIFEDSSVLLRYRADDNSVEAHAATLRGVDTSAVPKWLKDTEDANGHTIMGNYRARVLEDAVHAWIECYGSKVDVVLAGVRGDPDGEVYVYPTGEDKSGAPRTSLNYLIVSLWGLKKVLSLEDIIGKHSSLEHSAYNLQVVRPLKLSLGLYFKDERAQRTVSLRGLWGECIADSLLGELYNHTKAWIAKQSDARANVEWVGLPHDPHGEVVVRPLDGRVQGLSSLNDELIAMLENKEGKEEDKVSTSTELAENEYLCSLERVTSINRLDIGIDSLGIIQLHLLEVGKSAMPHLCTDARARIEQEALSHICEFADEYRRRCVVVRDNETPYTGWIGYIRTLDGKRVLNGELADIMDKVRGLPNSGLDPAKYLMATPMCITPDGSSPFEPPPVEEFVLKPGSVHNVHVVPAADYRTIYVKSADSDNEGDLIEVNLSRANVIDGAGYLLMFVEHWLKWNGPKFRCHCVHADGGSTLTNLTNPTVIITPLDYGPQTDPWERSLNRLLSPDAQPNMGIR